jgi:hypothetical protein
MAETYKVCLLARSNHLVAVQFVTADDDEAAIKAARELQNDGKCEIWHGERHVARIDLSTSDEPSAALWL